MSVHTVYRYVVAAKSLAEQLASGAVSKDGGGADTDVVATVQATVIATTTGNPVQATVVSVQ